MLSEGPDGDPSVPSRILPLLPSGLQQQHPGSRLAVQSGLSHIRLVRTVWCSVFCLSNEYHQAVDINIDSALAIGLDAFFDLSAKHLVEVLRRFQRLSAA